ncbi:MAG: pancortin-3 [Rhodopirellula sp.]|nr:pancortin-3 [Rhodopirellula sp.]
MHDYAMFGHDRAQIGRWLGFSAIVLAGAASQIFSWLGSFSGWEAFIKASLTTSAAYLFLHWIFNEKAWQINFFGIPKIEGCWAIDGKTLDEDGNNKYEWHGTLHIKQTWKQIQISLETEKSKSESYTATISEKHSPRGGWVLSYSYKNEPKLEYSHDMSPHKGYCEMEFDKDLNNAKATYFNSGGRKTYGIMDLKREMK